VNIGAHQIAERSIYHPMSCQRFDTREAIGDDLDDEMSAAVACTRMTCVSVTVVDYLELIGVESGFESRPNLGDARNAH